ncbi:carbamoyltransferase [Candidatus Woesearchaeota archaeon]|nr:carbamoyltransferase [Candidatus Woesearchaeota archaeon]
MYILGISCYYHDASAALLKDGVVVAAAEEERFSRKKHDSSFPINAVNFCLRDAGITIDEVSHIGFYEKPFLKMERVLSQHLECFPFSFKTFLSSIPSWINEKLRVPGTIRKRLKYRGDIFFVEHHLAHAAASFLVSPFRKAAVVTTDGVGEWTTTSFGVAENSSIRLMKEIRFPSSLGLLYSTVTAYLGFSVNNSEYKVMGLAPYGDMNPETNPYYRKLRRVIDVKGDGSYRLDMGYFKYHYADRMPSDKFCGLLGAPVTGRGAEMSKRHKDIAAAVQLVLEEVLTKILMHVHKVTKCDNLVLGGGVALNSVYNGKILRRTPFKRVWIQPNASDGGTSIGAASFVYHCILKNRRGFVQEHAYLGPSFSDEEIRSYLDKGGVKYSELGSDDELVRKTAALIHAEKVVGWFQGRMEWGPRALGARSILASPLRPEMKEILNLKVKHREKFRPFAPAVCEDDALKYFECDTPVPEPADFMLMVYPIRKRWRSRIPAVTHVDGSGRLQTVRRHQNPLYYGVIKEFGRLSSIPIIVNTSFNIRGEPIVCTPHDAYRCMMGTGIDCLVMGRFIVFREDNGKDMWDSEKLAED